MFCPEEPGQRARSIDATVFQQLPKLNCLTVAGGWGRGQWACCVAAPACGTSGARAGCSLVRAWTNWMVVGTAHAAAVLAGLPAHSDMPPAAGYWGTLDMANLPTRLKHLSLRWVGGRAAAGAMLCVLPRQALELGSAAAACTRSSSACAVHSLAHPRTSIAIRPMAATTTRTRPSSGRGHPPCPLFLLFPPPGSNHHKNQNTTALAPPLLGRRIRRDNALCSPFPLAATTMRTRPFCWSCPRA